MNRTYLFTNEKRLPDRLRAIFVFSLLLLTGFISGCATPVKPEPFAKFAESTETLRDGTDKAMAVLIPKAVSRYKKELQKESSTEQLEMLLSARLKLKPGSSFEFEAVPAYMVFDQFKVGLRDMTDALHNYSVLLRDFANDEIQSKDEFDKFAKELNTNAFEALKTIDKAAGENSANNIGLISSVAATAFNNYLQDKKKDVLVDAVVKNQAEIERFTAKAQQAIRIIAIASNQEYGISAKEYVDAMRVENKRSSAIDSLIKLNREHFSQIQALKALSDAVGKFPSAHKELKNAAINPDNSLAGIIELVNRGNQLKAMVDNAKKANTNTLLKADASNIESQAIALEVEAKIANLNATNAQASAVVARLAADADPSNTQKEQKAIELEENATQLKQVAEKKATDAKVLREAADAVKASVQALTGE